MQKTQTKQIQLAKSKYKVLFCGDAYCAGVSNHFQSAEIGWASSEAPLAYEWVAWSRDSAYVKIFYRASRLCPS